MPLDILLANGKPTEKQYFIYLPGDFISLIDREKSIFLEETDMKTGKPIISRIFPKEPACRRIDQFIISKQETPDIFFCKDILSLVCTDKFFANAESENLKGLNFRPIDLDFRYNTCDDE